MKKERFFIFCYYGWRNTGDDTILYALLQELHDMHPSAIFTVLAREPVKVPIEVKGLVRFVKPLPRAIFPPRAIFYEIPKSSAVILGGGTSLLDYKRNPRLVWALFQIFIMLAWSKFLKKRVYLLGIGIDSALTRLGGFLIKRTCQTADFISVRDKTSYEILKAMGEEKKATLGFDLSVLLRTSPDLAIRPDDKKILGVSVISFFEVHQPDKQKHHLFISELAKGLNQWLQSDPRRIVHLLVFKGKSQKDDVRITNLLRMELQPPERVNLIPYNPDPRIMLSEVASCHAFVGMRLHSGIFAYITNTPLVIINYLPKCLAFAKDIELSEQAIVSPKEILDGQFGKYVDNLQHHPDDFLATLPLNIARQRAKDGLVWAGEH